MFKVFFLQGELSFIKLIKSFRRKEIFARNGVVEIEEYTALAPFYLKLPLQTKAVLQDILMNIWILFVPGYGKAILNFPV